jgi:hypothetical protein
MNTFFFDRSRRAFAAALFAPVLLVPLLLAAATPQARADDADTEAQALLVKADEYRNFRGKPFSLTLTLVNRDEGEDERTFRLQARIQDSHTSLVIYEQPSSEQGKALLMDGNNLWFSTPSNSKPIRITPQQRLMGEVSNGDVASTDFSGDYTASIAAREQAEGQAAVKLELLPRAGGSAAYGKLHLWVAQQGAAPLKADFFGPSGKLLKTAFYRRYEQLPASLGGKRQLVELEIVNALNPGKRTVMRYADFKLGGLNPSMFTTAYLAKLR